MEDKRHCKRQSITEDEVAPAEVEMFIGNENKIFSDDLGPRWKFWRRKRYTVLLMISLGEIIKLLLRSNLSIAIFPMTENYTVTNENGTEISVQDFDWDVKTIGYLLSVFFYGYIATNLIGGILAVKYGAGKLFGYGVVLTSITTLFTPLAARLHIYFLITVRIFEGMCEGVLGPSMELLLANWIPAEERSTCIAISSTAFIWGHTIGVAASSAIGFHCGWEAIFYCTGSVGVAWFGVWLIFVKEHPKFDCKISFSELAYIQNSPGRVQQSRRKVSSIPFMKIVTSFHVWAIIAAQGAASWNTVVFMTHSPAYVKDVLKLDYHKSGYLSSLPFVLSVLFAYIVSPVADVLVTRKMLAVTAIRKIHICGSLTIMAIFEFLINRSTSATAVIACLSIVMMLSTVCFSQVTANALDIAPMYASVIGGFMMTTVSLCGMLAPTLTGYLTQNKTAEEWQTVFYIQSGICMVGALMYLIFGSGQLQPWAVEKNHELSG